MAENGKNGATWLTVVKWLGSGTTLLIVCAVVGWVIYTSREVGESTKVRSELVAPIREHLSRSGMMLYHLRNGDRSKIDRIPEIEDKLEVQDEKLDALLIDRGINPTKIERRVERRQEMERQEEEDD